MAPPFPYAGYSEDVVRRVRVLFGGKFVVDAQKPKLVWEHPYFPCYYFPKSAVSFDHLQNARLLEDSSKEKLYYDLVVGDRTAEAAVILFQDGPFKDFVKVVFDKADAWFEEDERVYAHPKDPYKIFPSSKHVRVEIDGVEVANTRKPKLLYETGLPIRYYIPMTDVRLDLLTPSDSVTTCPYKGDASYFDITLPSTGAKKEGLVWWYKTPTLESAEIRGHVAFYDEKLDVWVDGVKQERPVTK
ncbi:hypothetical protein T310_3802 [Rasamsonia emersonii CBS 393.64]|uniref:DUF427 domain-containing protein n=1 Tax=Rasamsonia emersonii (strain ATCC 16479 / CBS 393.64 / IMI 116815) TaxID=1408163 RepID=A0A0F4YVQ6_RASE3|nr:hypothetical protein T310_3802 [Rasamsonia emersonii CBS 393.64]KKA22165.1 hypothetical protein T310_3802 [Rasamsonia emersonii CBS 393.64]